MKNLIKRNRLFLFLSLSICGLLLSQNNLSTFLLGNGGSEIKQFQSIDKIVHIPNSFGVDKTDSIFSYDPNFDLFYSVDGGDSFQAFKTLIPADVKPNTLHHYNLSYRSKPVDGVQPIINSFIIKGQHKTAPIFLKDKYVTVSESQTHQLPILNIVASEKELFSDQSGILVLGQGSWFDTGFHKPFWERNANYKIRKEGSKKKAFFQIIEHGAVKYENYSYLQISGNATRAFPQKSFKLKANRAEGSALFNHSIFGEKGLKKYTSLVVRNSGNDNTRTLFADMLMHRLAKKSKVLIQKGFPIVVYINGNYWGIYNLRERIDPYFIAKHEKVSANEVTILEGANGDLKDGREIDQVDFINLVELIVQKKTITESELDTINESIKLKSFMDYIILETFYGNGDWLHNNVIWYKASTKKWKWVLNDLDYGLTYLGKGQVNINLFNYLENSQTINAKLFRGLIKSKKFKTEFKLRASHAIEKWFKTKRIEKYFYQYYDQIYNEIPRHIKRWRGNFTAKTWILNAESNLEFLMKRRAIYMNQIEAL